jgi:hypothetical protein
MRATSSVVANGAHESVLARRTHADPIAGSRVADRVRQEVLQRSGQRVLVAGDRRQRGLDVSTSIAISRALQVARLRERFLPDRGPSTGSCPATAIPAFIPVRSST